MFFLNNNTGFVPTGSSRQEEDVEGEEGGEGTVGRGGGGKKTAEGRRERRSGAEWNFWGTTLRHLLPIHL